MRRSLDTLDFALVLTTGMAWFAYVRGDYEGAVAFAGLGLIALGVDALRIP